MPVFEHGRAASVLAMGRGGAAGTAATTGVAAGTIVLAVWAIGGAAFLIGHVARYRRFRRALMTAAGPLALGFRRPIVAVPADWTERLGARERDLALADELDHHARGDIVANRAALAMLALHWFDPTARIAFRAFRADQERATDARAVASGRGCGSFPCTRDSRCGGGADAVARLSLEHRCRPQEENCHVDDQASPPPSRGSVGGIALAGFAASAAMQSAAAAAAGSAGGAGGAAPVRTIVIQVAGDGARTLLIDGRRIASDVPVPAALVLPKGVACGEFCTDVGSKSPISYIVKGEDGEQNYTVSCTGRGEGTGTGPSAATGAGALRASYRQATARLLTMRASVAAQAKLPEPGRRTILADIDTSVADVARDLACAN